MVKNIFLLGGRTGGPLIPLLAIWEGIKVIHTNSISNVSEEKIDLQPIIIGVERGFENRVAKQNNYLIEFLPEAKLNIVTFNKLTLSELIAGIVDTFWNIIKLSFSFWKSIFLLIKYRPIGILSTGSFLAVPMIWAAKVTNFLNFTESKIIIHQQDPLPGLANRLTIKAADYKSCTFEYTKNNYKDFSNCQLIPNPIDCRKYDQAEWMEGDTELVSFVQNKTKPLLLVFGGGGGAQVINYWVINNLTELTSKFEILHLTGTYGQATKAQKNPNYISRISIVADMPKVLVKADLVLCRAGIGSITELSYLNKPAFICPIANSHQIKNAELTAKYFYILSQEATKDWCGQIFAAYPQFFEQINFPSKSEVQNKLRLYYNNIADILFDKS